MALNGDVAEDLVRAPRESELKEVPGYDLNMSSLSERILKTGGEAFIEFDGDEARTSPGKLMSELAAARPYLNDQIVAGDRGLVNQPGG